MPEKATDFLSKRDLETILKVNEKAIEIQNQVADQNEDILSFLGEMKNNQKAGIEKIDKLKEDLGKITKSSEDMSKDIYKLSVLLGTSAIALIVQIIQIFVTILSKK